MPTVDNFGGIQTYADKAELIFKHYGNDFAFIQTDKKRWSCMFGITPQKIGLKTATTKTEQGILF